MITMHLLAPGSFNHLHSSHYNHPLTTYLQTMENTPTPTPTPYSRKLEFCTTRDAADQLGVSLRTAQLWVDSGILEAWKTEGGHRRISVASVERLMHAQTPPPSTPHPAAQVAATALGGDRLKILVAEDDNVLMKLYRARIAAWGLPIDVTTASNGYEALVLVGREQPDLMISDLLMPGMDGFQMVRTLTASSFREGMEIVVVTGMDAGEITARGGLPPGVRVLTKPVPFGELKALAETLIARRVALLQG
jgi:excisionase family DNA binding protein